MAWKKLCLPKRQGGLGFKSFETTNQELLAKQLWRLHKYPDSLVAKVLKGRYYRKTHPFEARKPNRPSYGWRSIWSSKSLMDMELRRTIGVGRHTQVWPDNWLPDRQPQPATELGWHYYPHLRVEELLDTTKTTWNVPLVNQMINQTDIPLVLSVTPSVRATEDGYCWHYSKSENYTVKSGYEVLSLTQYDEDVQLLLQEPSTKALKNYVWKKYIEEKINAQEKTDWVNNAINKGFTALEKLLVTCSGKYATGDEIYLADLFLAPQIYGAINRFHINMEPYPTLAKCYESYNDLPAFKGALPEKQPDALPTCTI